MTISRLISNVRLNDPNPIYDRVLNLKRFRNLRELLEQQVEEETDERSNAIVQNLHK